MKTLGNFIVKQAAERGDSDFLIYKAAGKVVHESYVQFCESALGWAQFIKTQGVTLFSRVLILSPKGPAQVRAIYGAWLADCVVVPVCETLSEDELRFIATDAQPSLILIDDSIFEPMCHIFSEFKCHSFDEVCEYDQVLARDSRRYTPHERVEEKSPAVIIYTSGSTGNPKGVVTSHQNLLVNASSAGAGLKLGADECVMSILPYWHTFALTVELVFVLEMGGSIALVKDQREFKHGLTLYEPTIILAVPRVLQALKEGIMKTVKGKGSKAERVFTMALKNSRKLLMGRTIFSPIRKFFHNKSAENIYSQVVNSFSENFKGFVVGGAPLDVELDHFFTALGLPVYLGYGLSETSPIVSINTPERKRAGSSGPLLNWLTPEEGGDFTFQDESGRQAKTIEGELLVKGKCVMTGYWQHSDASAKTIVDGWLYTGDVAKLDKDGFLFIKGRVGNMLVLAGGENLHPEPIEDLIKQSNYFSEVMVIGDNLKNPYVLVNLSELGHALPKDELDVLLKSELLKLTQGLVNFKRPKALLVLPEFNSEDGTLTSIKKIRRFKILEKYSNEISDFIAQYEKKK